MDTTLQRSLHFTIAWIAAVSLLWTGPVFALAGGKGCSPIDPRLAQAAKYDSPKELEALVEFLLDERLERYLPPDLDVIRQKGVDEWRRATKNKMLTSSLPELCEPLSLLWYAVNYGNISVTTFMLSLGEDGMTWDRNSFNQLSGFPNYFSDCGRWAGRPKDLNSSLREDYYARIRKTYGLLAANAEKSYGASKLQIILEKASNEPSCQQEDGFYNKLMLDLINQSRRRQSAP
jgi:hypothetical protein